MTPHKNYQNKRNQQGSRIQDLIYRNLLHLFTLTMKYQKEKVKKFCLKSHPIKIKNKPRNKFNQGGERPTR